MEQPSGAQPQQSFGVQQQQPFGSANGFVFGAGSPAPSGNTAFNFSTPNTSNPFTNANGSSSQGQASTPSEDVMMESPQKKRNTGSIFDPPKGDQPLMFAPWAQPSGNSSGVFGQNTNTGPSTNFGNNNSSQTTGIFGAPSSSNVQPQSQTAGIFGAPSANNVPPQASSFTFGQTSSQPIVSNNDNTAKSQSSSFSFGQTQNTVQNTPSVGFNNNTQSAPSAGFKFGQTSSTAQNNNTPDGSRPASPFGAGFTPKFPATSAATEPAQGDTSQKPIFGFGKPTSQTPLTSSAPAQQVAQPTPSVASSEATKRPLDLGNSILKTPRSKTSKTADDAEQNADSRPPSSITTDASSSINTTGFHSFSKFPSVMTSPGSNLFSEPLTTESPSISTTFSPSGFSPIEGNTSLFQNLQSTPKTSNTSNLFSRLTQTAGMTSGSSQGSENPFKSGDTARQQPNSAGEVLDPRKRRKSSDTVQTPKSDNVIFSSHTPAFENPFKSGNNARQQQKSAGEVSDAQKSQQSSNPLQASENGAVTPSNKTPAFENPFKFGTNTRQQADSAREGYDPRNPAQASNFMQTPKNDRGMSRPEASSTATPLASNQSQSVSTPATTLKVGSTVEATSSSQPSSSAVPAKFPETSRPRMTEYSSQPASTQSAERPRSPLQPPAVSKGLWQHPSSPTTAPPEIKTRSNGSSIFNPDFTPTEHVGFNKSYRLRSLDREFQRRISGIDMRVHDLAPLIKYYVEMRGSIGEAIGGVYTRTLAGTKRKADDPRGQHEDSLGPSKRSRSEFDSDAAGSSSSSSLPASNPTLQAPAQETQNARESGTSSLFTKVISPPQAKMTDEAPVIPASAPAKTTFGNNMFAASPVTNATAPSAVKAPSSFFASTNSFSALTPSSSMQMKDSSVEKAGVSGFSKAQSTTPAKSPPKKPMAGMPVFQPSFATSNFAAFKAGAERTARQESAKRKAEEYDSEEETEEEYSDRAKKARLEKDAKIDAIPKLGFKPSFGTTNSANLGEKTPVQSAKPSLGTPHNSSEYSSFFATSSLIASDSPDMPVEKSRRAEKSQPKEKSLFVGDSDSESEDDGTEYKEKSRRYYESENDDVGDEAGDRKFQENDNEDDEDPETYNDIYFNDPYGNQESDEDDGNDHLQGEEDDDTSQNGRNPDQQHAAALNKGKSLFDRIERPPTPEAGQPTEEDFEAHDELSESKDSPTSPPEYGDESPIRQEPVNNSFKPGLFLGHLGHKTPKAPVASPFTPLNGLQGSPIRHEPIDNSFKPGLFGADLAQNTPKAPVPSPFTPLNESSSLSSLPSSMFSNFTPRMATPTAQQATSVLFGAPTRDGPIRGEGLFGSRPSTPVQDDQPTKPTQTPFGTVGRSGFLTPGDHTWQRGSPIKFDTSQPIDKGPTLNITEATPPPKEKDQPAQTFSSLFGSNLNANKPTSSFGAASSFANKPTSSFGAASSFGAGTKPANGLGFGFSPLSGHLTASSHLAPTIDDSGRSSRASTPGLTDNESVATNETEDATNDPQTSLMNAQDGNEDEELLVDIRAKGCKWEKAITSSNSAEIVKEEGYHGQGVGPFKIYRNKTTGKTRMLLRSEPRGNITINANLMSNMNYTAEGSKSGAMRFGIMVPGSQVMERWMLKFKTRADADKVAKLMEENKAG